MSSFLQAVVSGLVTGSIYALMTVGMTLIYGALRTLNMAHGSMVMIGGYVSWMLFSGLALLFWAVTSLPFAQIG